MIQDMNKTLTKLFTVALLMMVSLGAKADVKVLFGEKGTEKFEGSGGSIKIEQADSKVDKTKVTVYLTFIPQSGYAFDEKSLGVYAVVSTSTASTRAPEISGDPLKLTEEKTDVPSAKRYSVDIDSKLALWVKEANFDKKQEDSKGNRSLSTDYGYSGTYYIASDYQTPNTTTRNYDPNPTTLTNNYYLCPTENWISFGRTDETKDTWTTGDDNPFLTTYKARLHANDPAPDTYDLTKAKWTIEYYTTVSGKDYYYFKHGSGKYMVLNKQIDGMKGGSPENRIRVHLEELTPEQLADETTRNMALFTITQDNRSIFICPKNQSSVHLTVNNGNNDHPYGYGNNKGTIVSGSTTYGMEGTIGIYGNSNTDDNKYLYLEDYITRPTITYNEANDEITITAVQTGVDLIYTTDGTTPSTTNPNATSITGTVGNPTTVTFHPSDGETTIKAVAVVNGELSNVAKFITPVFFGSQHKYLIQSQNDPWNTTDFHFYMIPGDEDANSILKVNTTSLFRPTMEWYFLNAGIEGGVQYYYIVNNTNGKYLCYDTTNKIYMDDYSEATKFKFSIVESATAGTYLIKPYGQSNNLFKTSGNANAAAIDLNNSTTSGNTRWKFIVYSALDKTTPFMVSDDTSIKYYKIASVGSSGYFIVPGATNATTSDVDNDNMNWYFEEAQTATSSDWCTYYHIRNAVTGDYLYFTKDKNNDGACLATSNPITEGSEDRYMFTWAKTADANVNYYIIPKLLKDASQNQFSSLRKNDNNTNIVTNVTRTAGNYAWTFGGGSFTCATPSITYNSALDAFVITTSTLAADIYYTTDGSDPTPTTGTKYTAALPMLSSPGTIKAITARSSDGSDMSGVASWVVEQVATPTFDTSSGNSVAINCTIDGATIYYTTDGSDPTTESAIYSLPLKDGISGKTIKAMAVKGGMFPSAVAELEDVVTFKCATPVVKRGTGKTFVISCSYPTEDVSIYYSIDGSTPTTLYEPDEETGGIAFTGSSVTIKAVAKATGYTDSDEAERTITESLQGGGTSGDPYLIESAGDFDEFVKKMRDNTDLDKYYQVTDDFSVGQIQSYSATFTGVFDGQFHTISGLSHALFNIVDGGTVKNVILNPGTSTTISDNGAICNQADGSTKIYNCGVLSGTVSGSGNVGGLVGQINSGSSARVVNCYNFANVNGTAGIVGNNLSSDSRIALCMMYGNLTGGTSPVYAGTHTSNNKNFTEYNYWLYSTTDAHGKKVPKTFEYSVYNDQLAIDKEEFLTRFPFYRHILNTHRELASYFLFGDYSDDHVAEIGHWTLKHGEGAPKYPIVEEFVSNTHRTTQDIESNLPDTSDEGKGKLLTQMGSGGYVTVNITINGSSYSKRLPITDMNEDQYDYTWGKIVLPFANEFSGWTRDWSKVCTGWKITSIDGGTAGSYANYDMADRDCTAKDLYSYSNYIFAQGGNYIVPYGVYSISITAHFANAFYLSDPSYEIGYDESFNNPTQVGGSVRNSFHEQTVFTDLTTLVTALAETTNPHVQAIVLVGNFHYMVKTAEQVLLNTGKAVTIMSADEDNNQEPDYGWYMGDTFGRLEWPAIRFDFVPIIELGMSSRVNSTNSYPGIGIWRTKGWFEQTETCVSFRSQCEINSADFAAGDDGKGNNRWIVNSGYYTQIVRAKSANCTKLSYIQIGGNAYVKELYPGSHTDQARTNTAVPINVTGGQVDECYMTGIKAGGKLSGPMIYFWCSGGKIGKFLGSFLEEPQNAGLKAKVDHALIGRFFGGGTSASARIKGDIDITINNSTVDFYCGGPEFGDMYSGKTITTHATGTTFGEYYGAGFGGTSVTYNREDQINNREIDGDILFPISFNKYKYLTKNNDYGIGTCYKFEYIYHSNGHQVVARFYTGYAQFSLATTGNVTNILNGCKIKKLPGTNSLTPQPTRGYFYGAGCQGKVSGTVTSTLTGCEIEESAFGGGYKAAANNVDVYLNGESGKPDYSTYYKETGIFTDFGEKAPISPSYKWVQGDDDHDLVAGTGTNAGKLFTSKDIQMTDLGNVTGAISITIDGGSVGGDVYGGGDESKSLDDTTVTLKGNLTVGGDVFGGGNKAEVNGTATVNIE